MRHFMVGIVLGSLVTGGLVWAQFDRPNEFQEQQRRMQQQERLNQQFERQQQEMFRQQQQQLRPC